MRHKKSTKPSTNMKGSAMKKILLIATITLLSISIAFSQITIKGGMSLAKVAGDDSKRTLDLADLDSALSGSLTMEPKMRMGFVAGIAFRLDLPAGITIQPEVLYIQKGAVYDEPIHSGSGATGSVKQTMKLDYIEIPLMLRYSLPVPIIKPYLEAGLSYGILSSAKIKTELSVSGAPGTPSPVPEKNIKDDMNKRDLSIQIGTGLSIIIIELNARYIIGLSKNEGDLKKYNRTFIITAGFSL